MTPAPQTADGAASALPEEDTTRKRSFLTTPGDILLLPPSLMDIPRRHLAFVNETGLSSRDTISSTMASVPLPRYPVAGFAGRRWDGVLAEAMWLPLMWLPVRVALPYRTDDPAAGASAYESTDEWAARVVLELVGSGLYDPETGLWVDVLALHGVDIDDPPTLERVGSWLAGADDPVLDRIDLSPYFTREGEEHWAAEAVEAMSPALLGSRFALLASDIGEMVDDLANPDMYGDEDIEPVRSAISQILEMAQLTLLDMPHQALQALGHRDADGLRHEWDSHLERVQSAKVRTLDELLETAVAPAARSAAAVRDIFSPDYEKVSAWLSGEARIPGMLYDEDASEASDEHGADSDMRMLPRREA